MVTCDTCPIGTCPADSGEFCPWVERDACLTCPNGGQCPTNGCDQPLVLDGKPLENHCR